MLKQNEKGEDAVLCFLLKGRHRRMEYTLHSLTSAEAAPEWPEDAEQPPTYDDLKGLIFVSEE